MSDGADRQPESPASQDFAGRIGKYQVVRPLGRGAMGRVYVAHDTSLERDVALKVMAAQAADDPQVQERFAREARAVARLTHPNVVTVYELGYHTDGSPFIAMELLHGQDLARALRTPPPLTLDRKLGIVLQVLAGLAHAHHAGIVHRDVKPANVFICEDGIVKIMDFGVARLATASLTGTGNIVGTADYMSPEQVKGARVDGRSDVFSVGCLLYEMVTGRRPFHADSLMAIFYKITHEEPAFETLPPGPEHEALRPILAKAMAKDLTRRYASCHDLAVDLKAFLKRHASSSALEGLLEVEGPPPGTPGPTLVVADELAGSLPATAGRAGSGSGSPTSPGALAPTTRMAEAPRPAPRPAVPAPRPLPARRPRPAPPPAARGLSPVVIGAGVVALAGVVVLGLMLWRQQRPGVEQAAPSAQPATVPSPAATAPPTPSPMVTAAAPAATPAAPASSAAALPPGDLRAAAARQAQRQAEEQRLRLETERAAEEQRAQQQRQHQEQLGGLLTQADGALAAQKYDDAISLYNEALKLDPQNDRALRGRSDAVSARAVAAAAAAAPPAPAPGRGFAAGKTAATGGEARAARGETPAGFEVTPEVKVGRATQAAALPGKIHFDVEPERVKAGDPYRVRILFVNEGDAPIQIRDMVVGSRVNGRLASGPVPPLTSSIAPQGRVLLREVSGVWKEDTASWQMEVTVRTQGGETYRNELAWK